MRCMPKRGTASVNVHTFCVHALDKRMVVVDPPHEATFLSDLIVALFVSLINILVEGRDIC